MEAASSLDVFAIVIGLAGGLALFLYGMEQLAGTLKLVAGGRMKTLLARLTTNRFTAAAAGAFVTAVIQSSSVTTVLVVGFVSAGLMTLAQSVGVIMGANVGTTITAQIIAFKVTQYALVLVAVGFAGLFLGRTERIRQYGTMLMGLGLIFFGMELMSEATRPLRSYEPFIALMGRMEQPLLAILLSAAFTGLVQSSSATTGVIIVLATQGFITLEAGIALAFGANIGTCVTALLAALGKPREAVQAAFVHVVFNVLGVVIWLGFIDELAWLVRAFSPGAEELAGAERLAAETPRQIANAHTFFNVANTILFIGFTRPLARLVERLVPHRPAASERDAHRPRYLDELLLDTPALAIDRGRMELRRLGERVLVMVERSLSVAVDGDDEELQALAHLDDEVDALHGAIVAYLGRLSQSSLSTAESRLLADYLAVSNTIENIGDMIETNIVEAGRERLRTGLAISRPTRDVLEALHARVTWSVRLALQALDASDAAMAAEVVAVKPEVARLAWAAETHLTARLSVMEADRLPLYRIESEIIEYLKRVYYFAKRIAKTIAADRASHEPKAPTSAVPPDRSPAPEP